MNSGVHPIFEPILQAIQRRPLTMTPNPYTSYTPNVPGPPPEPRFTPEEKDEIEDERAEAEANRQREEEE